MDWIWVGGGVGTNSRPLESMNWIGVVVDLWYVVICEVDNSQSSTRVIQYRVTGALGQSQIDLTHWVWMKRRIPQRGEWEIFGNHLSWKVIPHLTNSVLASWGSCVIRASKLPVFIINVRILSFLILLQFRASRIRIRRDFLSSIYTGSDLYMWGGRKVTSGFRARKKLSTQTPKISITRRH